ncbi:MAG: Mov34/MPN/PAD-1 family protein [Candidatus Dormibacterales bacterium]
MRIDQPALDEIAHHGEEGYPHEVCGIMIGPHGDDRVTEARRARNTVVERARDRYEMDPLDQIRVQRECDERGMEVLGYYHSHPDHPAQASATDAGRSWAGWFYLIVSVTEGRAGDRNVFVAERDGGPMRPEPLEVVERR